MLIKEVFQDNSANMFALVKTETGYGNKELIVTIAVSQDKSKLKRFAASLTTNNEPGDTEDDSYTGEISYHIQPQPVMVL